MPWFRPCELWLGIGLKLAVRAPRLPEVLDLPCPRSNPGEGVSLAP